MRYILYRLMLIATVPMLAAGAIALTPATTASAISDCTGTSLFTSNGIPTDIPTIGNGTHLDNCQLGPGNVSGAVGTLQNDMNACYHFNLTVDNIFGQNTENALLAVQRHEGVAPDGIYGPITRQHMLWHRDIRAQGCMHIGQLVPA